MFYMALKSKTSRKTVKMTEYSDGFPRFILVKLRKSAFSFVKNVNMYVLHVKFIPTNF